MTVNVIINGAFGKMGTVAQQAIRATDDFKVVATLGRTDDLAKAIKKTKADMVVDFTTANAVYQNTHTILSNRVKAVIGTSGLHSDQLNEFKILCEKNRLGAVIVPNFCIGALLMMKYAQDASRYFSNVEIVETHHAEKQDAPSGTARHTAELISQHHQTHSKKQIDTTRAKTYCNIPIHSIRLSGVFARQSVLFGGTGETLTIQHDASDRSSIIPGLLLACRKVMTLNHLVYGLENITALHL